MLFAYNNMNSGIISIGLSIVVISAIIYIIKNKKEFKEKYNLLKIKNNIKIIFMIIIFILFITYSYSSIKQIYKNIKYLEFNKKSQKYFDEFDQKIEEEISFYNETIKQNNLEEENTIPYIPEGFAYIEGDIESGYVIQDIFGNQYVWIPCSSNESGVKLAKRDFYNPTSVRWYNCVDLEYKKFIESTILNGGFYISRFELGEENNTIVSKNGAKVLTNISRKEAIKRIESMYENVNCELINGYAYDTALEWIKKNNDIEIYAFDSLENITCGRIKYNNIYDFTDNIMEITLEDSYDTIIYRGFYNDKDLQLESRYGILEEKIDKAENLLDLTLVNLLAFRSVIYK